MRKFALAVVSAALALAGTGCIVVVDSWDPPRGLKVVEIDGELYVADTQTRRLHKLDDDSVVSREITTETGVASPAETAKEAEPAPGGQ